MRVLKTIDEARELFNQLHKGEDIIGMVPTMGALHEGHASLIKQCRSENDIVIISIFVNPIQFGPDEDYEAYPRQLDEDIALASSLGVDYIFHPSVEEMYPKDFATYVEPPKEMTNVLCGASRPGHFKGVTTVLCKLFSIIRPHRAYFGKKDIQQLAIVRRMVEDLNFAIDIIGCPIVREEDGLAKSSRNAYLSTEEREAALVLRRSLLKGQSAIESGERDPNIIKNIIQAEIESEALASVDYVELLNFKNFKEQAVVDSNTLMAVAVYIGSTRLIDNILL